VVPTPPCHHSRRAEEEKRGVLVDGRKKGGTYMDQHSFCTGEIKKITIGIMLL